MSAAGDDPFHAAMRAAALALLGEPNEIMSSPGELRFGSHGSLSIDLSAGTFYDHEAGEGGGTLALVMRTRRCSHDEALRWLEEQTLIPPRHAATNGAARKPPTKFGAIVATYDYRDEDGALLFQVCRIDPPKPARFMQRRQDASGWVWNTKGVKRVPYRLGELLARDGSMIVIAEGEKDVDRLWANGIPATCNPGGAGKWQADFHRYFRDADVVIVPDNDEPGRKHRDVVGAALIGTAASVRVLDLPGLPEKGDASDWFDAGGTRDAFLELMDKKARAWRAEGETVQLHATPYDPAEFAALKPRQWVYGRLCVRKYVSLIGAPGGVGKTAYAIAVALAILSNRPLLGEKVHESAPVWLYNLEDDRDEMLRRVGAAIQYHGVDAAAVLGRLYVDSGRSQPLCIATRDKDVLVATPLVEQLVAELRARAIATLFVDPFVKSHRLEENRNEQIDFAASLWARVAEEAHCSIVLVHHFKKGGLSGESDAFRGASALIDAARSAVSLSHMTPEEAEHLAIKPERRWRYVRLDNAKLNLAPKPDQATWMELVSEMIESGDSIQVARTFEPPGLFAGISPADCNAMLDAIRDAEDAPLSDSPKSGARYVAPVMVAEAERRGVALESTRAMNIVKTWLASGALAKRDFKDEHHRPRKGLYVVDAKRPGAMPD